jgi:hypothetical protein
MTWHAALWNVLHRFIWHAPEDGFASGCCKWREKVERLDDGDLVIDLVDCCVVTDL